ncbi:UbiA family prenyltransferase [Thalassolituus marinus]|uniref:UbiA family prenyltransferase n=1 Tax=Thalassolituus marinus TaxID=671053 RepID=A0ABS7ZNT6_9GAMM|nr:UbiA family prenyltransferase [Thalassolituus marinus]MCA6063364.1 UbiA family prenyltransferase [Thalassolituus marinus]
MNQVVADSGSALVKRILAWMDERFPVANALLFFILYLVTASVARADDWYLGWLDVAACVVTWSLFLVIRIFDEHKDYELDVLNHPQRVLQSGQITLRHLKILGALAVTLQVAFSFYLGLPVLWVWLLMFVYLCLMGAEFFCGAWLEKRLLIYALSHMAIMPLIVIWLACMAQPGQSLAAFTSGAMLSMMALSFVSGFCFEITRKTRGPEEERETVDSYTKILGVSGAARLVQALITLMLICQWSLLYFLPVVAGWVYALLLAIPALFALKSVQKFLQQPSLEARESNEKAVALAMLSGYLLLIIAMAISSAVME